MYTFPYRMACMQVFHAGPVTKALVFAAQVIISPFCWFFCLCNPRFLNRFVGYLEELACETYSTVLDAMDDPEKQLYKEWRDISAPPVAIQYWKLDEKATWHDTLRRIYADETNHRDVNHCFADLGINERNPLLKHHEEIAKRHTNTTVVEALVPVVEAAAEVEAVVEVNVPVVEVTATVVEVAADVVEVTVPVIEVETVKKHDK